MTLQMTCIINGENEKIDLETAEQIWDMPVVWLWADILELFEGKGRSGSSSFWSMMCSTVKSVNPKIKGHPGDFAVAHNDLQQAWHGCNAFSSLFRPFFASNSIRIFGNWYRPVFILSYLFPESDPKNLNFSMYS
jgi:hypothetical protein